jgi:hypothetical protein
VTDIDETSRRPRAATRTKTARRRPVIIDVRPADANNQVVSLSGGGGGYRRKPCDKCPWRVDQTGAFPAEAFRHSASMAYDAAQSMFSCHMSGCDKPATCAGFLLKNAVHNVGVRLASMTGRIDPSKVINPDKVELHQNYRAMAVANGVPADDPVLDACRGNDEPSAYERKRRRDRHDDRE